MTHTHSLDHPTVNQPWLSCEYDTTRYTMDDDLKVSQISMHLTVFFLLSMSKLVKFLSSL
jgi:hypothetical protein